MSKAARLRAAKARQRDPRRTPWSPPRPGEQVEVAFIPALTINDASAIEDMKRQTHDGLLDMLDTRRRSGIRWSLVHGRTECEGLLRSLYGESQEDWAAVETQFLPFLAEHGDASVLVLAQCNAVVPR